MKHRLIKMQKFIIFIKKILKINMLKIKNIVKPAKGAAHRTCTLKV